MLRGSPPAGAEACHGLDQRMGEEGEERGQISSHVNSNSTPCTKGKCNDMTLSLSGSLLPSSLPSCLSRDDCVQPRTDANHLRHAPENDFLQYQWIKSTFSITRKAPKYTSRLAALNPSPLPSCLPSPPLPSPPCSLTAEERQQREADEGAKGHQQRARDGLQP